jgi:hypothetical protein
LMSALSESSAPTLTYTKLQNIIKTINKYLTMYILVLRLTYYVVQPGCHTWQDMSIPNLYSVGKNINYNSRPNGTY